MASKLGKSAWQHVPGAQSCQQMLTAICECGACREAGPWDAAKMLVEDQRFEIDVQSMDITAISVTSRGQLNPLPCCFATNFNHQKEV